MLKENYFYEESLELTKALVKIPSLNGTTGERDLAEYVYAWLAKLPYFQENPDQLVMQDLKNDPIHRANVLALVKGTRSDCKDTLILQGHCDTVDIEGYGSLKEFAFDYDALPEKIKALTDDPEVLADIESGEWMFGRGACDMKCGDAILMVLTKYFTEHLDQFDGNIVYMLNPVEENQHYGVMDSLDVLLDWRNQENLNYVMSINTDFFSPAFPGDTNKYFHSGAVGKILPCFYIHGRPTHVGHAYEGFSATLAASEIMREMELRADFADEYNGELPGPPLSLRNKDLKPSYNVTSPEACFMYFNYFIHSAPMTEIMDRLRGVAQQALDFVNQHTDTQFKRYCERTGDTYHPIDYTTQVLDYSELYAMAQKVCPDVDAVIKEITDRELAKDTDRREMSLMIVERLFQMCNITIPTIVVFIAPPYCPRNTMKQDVPEEKALLDDVRAMLDELAPVMGEEMKLMQFFPVLTDSSYLKIDDDQDSIDLLVNNFPGYGDVYNVPFDKIKDMNVPAFSFGCYGKDGHKWTERVNLPYTFGKLPNIIFTALERYLIK